MQVVRQPGIPVVPEGDHGGEEPLASGAWSAGDECPAGAIRPDGEGYPRIDRTACQKCFHCTEICYAGSKYIVGREPSVDDLFREIEKDRVFFTKSGGGVTFSAANRWRSRSCCTTSPSAVTRAASM